MKNICTLFILFNIQITFSQNLVLNPSFERQVDERCRVYLGGFNKTISGWTIPNMGSTDYFDTCSDDMGSKNYNGYQKPKSGKAYAGIYVYTDKNYREYVQGELSETLTKDEIYEVTFYLSLADKSSFAINDIEVLFTEEKLNPCYKSNSCEKAIKPKAATDKKFKIYSDNSDMFFADKRSWKAYTFQFKAQGYENFFSIGNFYRNNRTKTKRNLSSSPYLFSYYYIDEVSVIPLNKALASEDSKISTTKEELKIVANKTYTFKNVLFDFDKSELLNSSKDELKGLFKHLKANEELDIEIYGHTDNIGLDKRNEDLSKQRAKAVAQYLILLGIKEIRITYFGFGSLNPITTNKTEEGRQQNRRVEFRLIKK
ncbi:hypothetical protein BTO05_09080 [Winogradskyella sp. PC-19]|nr:OmpA family protein [Winogradskyella sp.]ARV09789.1 hypothetical protein BTO05_09080 [Winogradskyella sp. PC-19]